MFELVFGLVWLAITSMVAIPFALGGMAEAGMPILFFIGFFGLFYAIGIWMLVRGLKQTMANYSTSMFGKETYGIVTDIRETGCYVNGRPQLQADVMIVDSQGRLNRYSEVIGFDWYKYEIGDYLHVKHHKNDINILDEVGVVGVPQDILARLEQVGITKAKKNKPEPQYKNCTTNEPINVPKESDWDFSGTAKESDWNHADAYDWHPTGPTVLNGETNTKKRKVKKETIRINGVEYERKY